MSGSAALNQYPDFLSAAGYQPENVEYARLQIELQKETDTEHYYNYVQEVNEKQHILIHDIKNHLNTISQLNDGKHIDEITGYINNILGSDALRKSKDIAKLIY